MKGKKYMRKFENKIVILLLLLLILIFGVNTFLKSIIVKDIKNSFHQEVTVLEFARIDFDSGLVYKVEYEDRNSVHVGYSYVDLLGETFFYESYSVPNYENLVEMIEKIEISEVESQCITNGDGGYDLTYSLFMTFPYGYDMKEISMKYDIYYYIGFPYKSSEEVFLEKNAQFQFAENQLISTNEDGSYIMEMKSNVYYKLKNKNLKDNFVEQKNKAVVYVKSKDYVIREIGK